MKILVQVTTRAGGDLNPMVALVLGLRAAGCTLTVLADPAAAPIFAGLGLPVINSSPAWEVGAYVKNGLAESAGQPEGARQAAVSTQIAVWATQLRDEATALLQRERPDLILTSFFGTCVGWLLTQISGIPWCAINSTFYIGPNPPRPLERDFSARAAEVFHYSVIPYLSEAALVLHATDSLFDYDHRGMPPGHYYTGPLIWEAPGFLPRYVLDPAGPLLLATLSSLRQDDTPIARAAMNAMAHTRYELIVTIGHGHEVGELEPIAANAHVAQYIPHSEVLARGLLLIAHAGHGSVMKALWRGVPLVLVPWGRDQFGVAARAEHLGAAVVLPKEQLTVRAMAEAVDRALHDPRYLMAAQSAARRLHEEDPLATAVDLVLGRD